MDESNEKESVRQSEPHGQPESSGQHQLSESSELHQPFAETLPAAAPAEKMSYPASWKNLLMQSARTCLFKAPVWEKIQTGPATVLMLTLLSISLSVIIQRLVIRENASFFWRGLVGMVFVCAVYAWLSYYAQRSASSRIQTNRGVGSTPDTASVYSVMVAQGMLLNLFFSSMIIALVWLPVFKDDYFPPALQWAIFLVPLFCTASLQWALFWHLCRRFLPPFVVMCVSLCIAIVCVYGRVGIFWYPKPQEVVAEDDTRDVEITQELMEEQSDLLRRQVAALQPERRGVIDVFSITFAPYGDEDVFHNETAMVTQVMQQRFDAQGHTMELVNHARTLQDLPLATPLNLQRTITAVAQRMNRDEDILFLHLSSHGASDGELAASFWPLTVKPVTPQDLRRWLDEAGVKYRVISISACYSGTWIPFLKDDSTLVMTASDADHTSYGCGSKSPLTFFGRAMYDEQLRTQTLSFEEAHATAREVIRQREVEAGKDNGYSNPQISAGTAIRPRLAALQAQLSAKK